MSRSTGARDLDPVQREFIVRRRALGDSIPRICEDFHQEFKRKLSRQLAHWYDASDPVRREKLDPALVELYDRVFKEFREDTEAIDIAHRAIRLRGIQQDIAVLEGERLRLTDEKVQRRNVPLIMQLTEKINELREQAAKEAGGSYTNKHLIEHDLRKLSDEDLIAQAASIVGGTHPAQGQPGEADGEAVREVPNGSG